jgi:hypothetical protein
MAEWLRRLLGGQSYSRAVSANRHLERASRLRHEGDALAALAAAHEGLSLLRDPSVSRHRPVEATVLIGLTTLAEELGQELGQRGATHEDLADTLAILRGFDAAARRFPDLAKRRPESLADLADKWLPYLEERVGRTSGTAS